MADSHTVRPAAPCAEQASKKRASNQARRARKARKETQSTSTQSKRTSEANLLRQRQRAEDGVQQNVRNYAARDACGGAGGGGGGVAPELSAGDFPRLGQPA